MSTPTQLEVIQGGKSASSQSGKLAENIMHFGRVLRGAGLPLGPGQVIDAISAAECGCLRSREDFYWTLHTIFVKRYEHRALFDQAFHAFWQKPKMLEQLMQLFFQEISRPAGAEKKKAGHRRLANAMFHEPEVQKMRPAPQEVIEVDASYSFSAREVLREKDFEQMTTHEQAEARRAIASLRQQRLEIKTRRFRPARSGAVDMRRTLKAAARSGAGLADLKRRTRAVKEPPLVVLCDISGSMSGYSRMFLHFLHALTSDRSRVHVFLFGTRLTNITRALKRKDPDEAVEAVSAQVQDWSGGTRIGHCLKEFNYAWARRVLGQNAHVLLISDGLDRDDTDTLEVEIARLGRSAKRLIWLNPLLRFEGFEARTGGIRTILSHVDEFRPVHSLASLEDLAKSLTSSSDGRYNPYKWLNAAQP
ncbi:MAG: VWA domain-containing protein [Pseudomonadota bacterium]